MADWILNGNAGTEPETNFLGTTDTQPLSIRTNGIEAIRISAGRFQEIGNTGEFSPVRGNVGIGTATPVTKLHVVGDRIRLTDARARKVLDLRVDGGAVDVQADISSLFIHSNGTEGNNHILINPFPDEGNVGIGTTDPATKLHVNGSATVEILHITGGGDLAESFPVPENSAIEPGTVMVIDENHPGKLKISETAYDRKVAGVVSGAGGLKAGLRLRKDVRTTNTEMLVTMAGCIYCKAEAISNPIEPGDLLTTSDVPGHAMKAINPETTHGAVLGKAMSSLQEGRGLVLVIANLQ